VLYRAKWHEKDTYFERPLKMRELNLLCQNVDEGRGESAVRQAVEALRNEEDVIVIIIFMHFRGGSYATWREVTARSAILMIQEIRKMETETLHFKIELETETITVTRSTKPL
jgi:hypothetical protein